MKCLCITGNQPDLLQTLLLQLEPAGLAPPLPLQRDPKFTFAYWHEEIEKLRREDSSPNQTPGRLWDQLAAELFMANMERPLWGWAEARSLDMLDYWRKFETRLMFLLVYQPPEVALASFMEGEQPEEELQNHLAAWQEQHKVLLAFKKRHGKRCLLVRTDEALAHPAELAALLKKQLRLPLQEEAVGKPVKVGPAAMSLYLAKQLLVEHPAVVELGQELEPLVTPLVEDLGALEGETELPLLASYRQLRDRSVEESKMALLREQYTRLSAHLQQATSNYQAQYHGFQGRERRYCEQIQSLKAMLADNQRELENQLQELALQKSTVEKASKSAEKTTAQQRELQEENELLLLQLRQVQEELEASFLQHEEMKKTSKVKEKDLQTQLSQVVKARDDQVRLTNEKLIQVAALIKERDAQAKLTKDTKQQLDVAVKEGGIQAKLAKDTKQQLDVITKERDAQTKLATERQQQLEKDKKHIADLQKQLKAAKENTDMAAALKALEHKLKESGEENELLLLQLHQVQEELEHYFLQYQEQQNKLKKVEQRLQQLLERFPEYVEFSSVEIIDNVADKVDWRLHDLTVGAQDFDVLEFTTLRRTDGALALQFSAQPQSKHFFGSWRALSGKEECLSLHSSSVVLHSLSGSDYCRLNALVDFLIKLLGGPNNRMFPESFDPAQWLRDLVAYKAVLQAQLDLPRCEKLILKNEQVNPDYEHLWLVCEGLSFAGRQWPRFEFRISCAHVTPRAFGVYPKLEFPKGVSEAPFDNWFVESEDDHGSKLELRYNLPHGVDEATWNRLSKKDHLFIGILLQKSVYWLTQLEREEIKIRRSWEDWQRVLKGMLAVTKPYLVSSSLPRSVLEVDATTANRKDIKTNPLESLLASLSSSVGMNATDNKHPKQRVGERAAARLAPTAVKRSAKKGSNKVNKHRQV